MKPFETLVALYIRNLKERPESKEKFMEQKEMQLCIARCMLLLEANSMSECVVRNLSQISIETYMKHNVGKYSDRQRNTFKSAIEYLRDALGEEQMQINLKIVPILVCLADIAQDNAIKPQTFKMWWDCIRSSFS